MRFMKNCNDFTHGGLTEEECLLICKLLDQSGIDSIEVSGNGTSTPTLFTIISGIH